VKSLRRIPRVMFALLLAFLANVPEGFGQTRPSEETPQGPMIRERTGLVLISAEVTDAKGNRVTI